MDISTILFTVFGILAIAALSRRRRRRKSTKYDTYHDPTHPWAIVTSFPEMNILSKYVGELRFGPAFIHLRTEPENLFGQDYYGDWFYRTEHGVFFQKWNSNPVKNGVHTKVDNDLVFFNLTTQRVDVVVAGIQTFHWTMEENEGSGLTLRSNNGEVDELIFIDYSDWE